MAKTYRVANPRNIEQKGKGKAPVLRTASAEFYEGDKIAAKDLGKETFAHYLDRGFIEEAS